LVFAGTATVNRTEMVEFLSTTLGFKHVTDAATEADMFELPDGSRFAVHGVADLGEAYRSIGFLVPSLDEAVAELRGFGIVVDEPTANEKHRYAHFEAPDGHIYELVEERLSV
jgi:glyoxylase I family protein